MRRLIGMIFCMPVALVLSGCQLSSSQHESAVMPELSAEESLSAAFQAASLAVDTRDGSAPTASEAKSKTPLLAFMRAPNMSSRAELRQSGSRGNSTKSTVARDESVPFGVVGITCEARKSDLGTQVDQFPREGRAVWTLYDTAPSSTGQRTQYITGFKDGCTRQVNASLVVFGSARLHEVHRYSSARTQAAWSEADKTYETIKGKTCGVPRKTPCPESKIGKLENELAFVSVYPSFGATQGRMELLLHKGALESEQIR